MPGEKDRIDIQFLPNLHGYICLPALRTSFVGICGKARRPTRWGRGSIATMRKTISSRDAGFYSHVLPSSNEGWKKTGRREAGWRGDAAGWWILSREGLYYAVRSADLARERCCRSPPKKAGLSRALRKDFSADLEFSSRLAKQVFPGTSCWIVPAA